MCQRLQSSFFGLVVRLLRSFLVIKNFFFFAFPFPGFWWLNETSCDSNDDDDPPFSPSTHHIDTTNNLEKKNCSSADEKKKCNNETLYFDSNQSLFKPTNREKGFHIFA